jgi:hypothetical protein
MNRHCTDYASSPVSKRRLKDSRCLPIHLAARVGDTAADLGVEDMPFPHFETLVSVPVWLVVTTNSSPALDLARLDDEA